MDILILGNGFDLAHGLKTKYSDFLEYCRRKYSINVSSGHINNVTSLTNNLWLRHFLMLKQAGDKWIDLEEEIYNVIKIINEHSKRITMNYANININRLYRFSETYIEDDFNLGKILYKSKETQQIYNVDAKEYVSIKDNIINNKVYYFKSYKGLINYLYDELRIFTKYFNDYLLEEVLPNIGNIKYKFKLSNNKMIRVLNFNYTDTYEKLYDLHSIYADDSPRYVYVHGKICNSEDCNLILGTHSFYNNLPNDLNEEINVEFNLFKKHNQRHRYGTIESYQGLLKELNDRRKIIVPNFHIIGHSLDKADYNILKHIFKAREKCNINIYYHNQEALNRLINNITEIIGEDEVMSKVKFIYQHDTKRGILIPQEKELLVTT